MSDTPKDCGYTKYTGKYVGGQSYQSRKPVMAEARRKVLNLLEAILETNPDASSVFNVFYRDSVWWHEEENPCLYSDQTWVTILSGHLSDLIKEKRNKVHDDTQSGSDSHTQGTDNSTEGEVS